MWAIPFFLAVGGLVAWQLFFHGEVAGEVPVSRDGAFGMKSPGRFVVKRVADATGVATVQLQLRVAMGAYAQRLDAKLANRLAHLLEESIEDSAGGVQVHRERDAAGKVRADITFPTDERPYRLQLTHADTARLARLLRLAAAPGRTLAEARGNAARKAPG